MALLKKTTSGCLKGTGQRPVISALFVRKVGNVGIGTTNPTSKFRVSTARWI